MIAKSLNKKSFKICNLVVDGKEITNDSEKVNIIANEFEKRHSITLNNPSNMDKEVEKYINELNINQVNMNCFDKQY